MRREVIGMKASTIWPRALASRAGSLKRVKARRARAAGDEGFTLVEILVVITIIGLIMGLVGPRVLNYLSESKAKAAAIQIQSLESALDLYYLDLGRYPTTAEGLTALVQRPGGTVGWNGPYLKNNSVPSDPWGRPYKYRSPSDHGAYEIVSFGAQGQEGNANIRSWELR
jgi:general secretion pathway protein G